MKNYFKIICVVLLAVLYSCEPDEYATPNIELVPIYRLTDTENDTYAIIDIYKEKSLLLIENKDFAVTSFITTEYVDTSTVDNYYISFEVLTESVDTVINNISSSVREEIITKTNTVENYDLGGQLETGLADLNIEVNKELSSVTTIVTIHEDGSEIVEVGDPVEESIQEFVLINGILTEIEVYN
ncbi:hypothetical protein [Saccharicrinis aurantiacus]|uniref:hypothetical protein n=1 Tax=Saccharicrinis aurantiacus TaxID=1849719 RepID=UPI000838A825|nr:hypothetical protein [Saccharicrinis aurantiacus]